MNSWMQAVLFLVVVGVFIATAVVTLRGLTGKVTVQRRYLGPLVAGLLLEVAGAVIFLFRTIDFSVTPASDFIATLPQEVSADTLTEARDNIRDIVNVARALPECQSKVSALQAKISKLEAANASAETHIAALETAEEHFLVRLVRFHHDATDFGGSLNLTSPPHPRKKELASRLLELLAELGEYDGPIEPDPALAKDALIQYQQSKGFSQVGWYSRPTFDAMVADHLAVALSAQQ